MKLMHILVHVLPKTWFIDLLYLVSTLLTLARLKTLTAFFSKQEKWKFSGSCMGPFNSPQTFLLPSLPPFQLSITNHGLLVIVKEADVLHYSGLLFQCILTSDAFFDLEKFKTTIYEMCILVELVIS